MKTLRITLIALVTLFVFASCSKKGMDDVTPVSTVPPAAELAGNYVVTQYRYNNESLQNLPAGRRIQISFGYVADGEAHMLFNESNNGSDTVDDYGNFDLKRVGRTIEVYTGSEKIGSYDNGVLEVGLAHPKGTLRFTAKRQ